MSYPTDRVILFDRNMNPLPELSPDEVLSRVRTEEINGEHSLVIVTTRRLEEGWRALTVDGMGKWREWVVTEIDEEHTSGKTAVGTYHFVWSLQYDLTNAYTHTHSEVGYGQMPRAASQVAAVVLDGVPRWTVGTCDAASIESGKGAVFIYESAWSKLSKVVEIMSCEVDAVIEVSNLYGVTARQLCLKAHVGNEEALRRFDWSYDLVSVKRTPDPGPYYCRVVPLGKGSTEYAEDDETTFEWPLDITEETGTAQNPGPYWIQDDEAAAAFRVLLSDGSYYYPAIAVSYSEDDPELLLNAARAELHDYTRPGVTYEADVVQLAQAGMDVLGVALGDEVQVVDYGFNENAGLRIQGRVIKIEVDELSPEVGTQLTIGQLRDSLTSRINNISATFDRLSAQGDKIYQTVAEMNTARYIDELLDRINREINATGGYAYFVPGEGIITYDVSVADPLVGSEATKVVQIKGGSVRIADTKKSTFAGIDDWEWRTVFTADGINSDLVTAVKIVSGYIGNATNGNYWNLDAGTMILTDGFIGDSTIDSKSYWNLATGELVVQSQTKNYFNQYDAMRFGVVTFTEASGWLNTITSQQTAPGMAFGRKDSPNLYLIPSLPTTSGQSTTSGSRLAAILAVGALKLMGYHNSTSGVYLRSGLSLGGDYIELHQIESSGTVMPGIIIDDYGTSLCAVRSNYKVNGSTVISGTSAISLYNGTPSSANSSIIGLNGSTSIAGSLSISKVSSSTGLTVGADSSSRYLNVKIYGSLDVQDGLFVAGNKSRSVDTGEYGTRLLSAYETTSPVFGDLGSGTLDENGQCYVMLDDIFGKAVRTDYNYYVFLQKHGEGDVWVSNKTADYFVVEGTPNLSFDWEVKARQRGFENERLESKSLMDVTDDKASDFVDRLESSYVKDVEKAADLENEYWHEYLTEEAR